MNLPKGRCGVYIHGHEVAHLDAGVSPVGVSLVVIHMWVVV